MNYKKTPRGVSERQVNAQPMGMRKTGTMAKPQRKKIGDAPQATGGKAERRLRQPLNAARRSYGTINYNDSDLIDSINIDSVKDGVAPIGVSPGWHKDRQQRKPSVDEPSPRRTTGLSGGTTVQSGIRKISPDKGS